MGDFGISYECQGRMIPYLRICIEIPVKKGYIKQDSSVISLAI